MTTIPQMPGFDLNDLKLLAYDAGEIHRKHFRLTGTAYEIKGDKSRVTAADTEVNRTLIQPLAVRFPQLSIVAEEGSREVEGAQHTLVVDDADGTHMLSVGVPAFCFMAALCYQGSVYASVVYEPMSDLMFTALKGQGAFVNGQPIQVAIDTEIDGCTVAIECARRNAQVLSDLVLNLGNQGAYTTQFYSFGYQAMRVAMGQYAGVIIAGGKPWDLIPVGLILQEAGAIVTDRVGSLLTTQPNGMVAGCTREVHSLLVQASLQAHGLSYT